MIIFILRYAFPKLAINSIYLIMVGVFGFLTVFYIALDVYNLKNIIHKTENQRLTINVILLLTFRLLIGLMNIV